MAASGVTTFVECGPGNVLAGLARRIDKRLTVHRLDSLEALQAALLACVPGDSDDGLPS